MFETCTECCVNLHIASNLSCKLSLRKTKSPNSRRKLCHAPCAPGSRFKFLLASRNNATILCLSSPSSMVWMNCPAIEISVILLQKYSRFISVFNFNFHEADVWYSTFAPCRAKRLLQAYSSPVSGRVICKIAKSGRAWELPLFNVYSMIIEEVKR